MRQVAQAMFDYLRYGVDRISPAMLVDFGLDGPDAQEAQHRLGLLRDLVLKGHATAEDFSVACGSGPKLSQLVKEKLGIEYQWTTVWDDLPDEEPDTDDQISDESQELGTFVSHLVTQTEKAWTELGYSALTPVEVIDLQNHLDTFFEMAKDNRESEEPCE